MFAIGGPAIILVSVNVRIVVLPVEYGNGFVCLQVQYFQCGTVLDVSDVFPIRRILGLETGSLFLMGELFLFPARGIRECVVLGIG